MLQSSIRLQLPQKPICKEENNSTIGRPCIQSTCILRRAKTLRIRHYLCLLASGPFNNFPVLVYATKEKRKSRVPLRRDRDLNCCPLVGGVSPEVKDLDIHQQVSAGLGDSTTERTPSATLLTIPANPSMWFICGVV